MRLSELFEDAQKERDFDAAWVASQTNVLPHTDVPPSKWGSIKSNAHTNMNNFGLEPDDAIGNAIKRAEAEVRGQQAKANRQAAQKQAQANNRAKPDKKVDRVKPTITGTPDADRTRQDALGRNLKADRYYNQLQKTPKGRDLIKRAIAKLGVPEPAVDEIVDVIADDVPQAIKKLDAIIKNPAAGIRARQARNQAT